MENLIEGIAPLRQHWYKNPIEKSNNKYKYYLLKALAFNGALPTLNAKP